jgi:SAM-dependent methyltransferase
MQNSDQALSESGIMFDHMRVGPFLENMVQARALGSAFELGFVDYLNHRCECVFSEIKEQLECDEAGLELLLSLLQANQVIVRHGEMIRLSPEFVKALPYSDFMRAKIEFSNLVMRDFGDLFTLLIKSPEQFFQHSRIIDFFGYNLCYDAIPDNVARTKQWMSITTSLTRYESLACLACHDFSDRDKMLDIGGNSGEFSLQVCRQNPQIKTTVFDLPVVCDIGREYMDTQTEGNRVSFIKGSAFNDPLPDGFDLISFKSMLHDWPEDLAIQLMEKAGQALEPGGQLLIFERAPVDTSKVEWPYGDLPFLLFFRSFRKPEVYTEPLRNMGFKDITIQKIDLEMTFFLITATKEQ